jgi:hypothetical protein
MLERTPHPRVFWQKRLQTIENKRQEYAKERKERPKRLQVLEGSRVEVGPSIPRTEERMVAGVGVHLRGDGKHAQLVEGGGDRGAAWRMRFWRLDTGGWVLETRKRGAPPPPFFHKC